MFLGKERICRREEISGFERIEKQLINEVLPFIFKLLVWNEQLMAKLFVGKEQFKVSMNLNKFLPLTETTFYIMLSLIKPSHGYAIMQNVEQLSQNKVKVAAGTLYGAVENLIKQTLIKSVENEDKRRKVYVLTTEGKDVLKLEIERMKHLINISQDLFK